MRNRQKTISEKKVRKAICVAFGMKVNVPRYVVEEFINYKNAA